MLILALLEISFTVSSAVDFDTEIRPILEENCVRCHGAEKNKGAFRMHTRKALLAGGDVGPGVIPGNSGKSELAYRISLPPEHDEVMPQEANALTTSQQALLRRWIDKGAEWPEGITLRPTKKRATEPGLGLLPSPPPKSVAEASSRLDEILERESSLLFPSETKRSRNIDDLSFLRRATIDLIGRIPTIEEIEDFRTTASGVRRKKLVESLLKHPRFSDRWTVFFSDMLRVRTHAPGGDHLLAFVHQSLSVGKPYDQLAKELISANGRPKSNPAVGFILADDADPMALAAATSQIFLGVRMACAECHDHPFDDWNQRQFYELAAYFGKTKKVESNFAKTLYTTEGTEMRVQWPPERDQPASREPVDPLFPFRLTSYDTPPSHITRLGKTRGDSLGTPVEQLSIEDLLNKKIDLGENSHVGLPDIAAEASQESAALDLASSLYRTSDLRAELADMVTSPRNSFFARAFVNRVWFELMGRGFVEPIDDLSSYREISHPATLQYLSEEFIASGYDIRFLIQVIANSDAYSRGSVETALSATERDQAERAYRTSPSRRMLSEALFDSILVAGHLLTHKWPDGSNVRTVSRQIRVPIQSDDTVELQTGASAPSMTSPTNGAEFAAGYDLEKSIELDFAAALAGTSDEMTELDRMRARANQDIEQRRIMEEMRSLNASRPNRYRLETIEEEIDDNPIYTSTMRMATPAPPAHFLRVFGQPSRDGLGEFRDHSSSLRQELMMLNGKATHEAARVGKLEPLHKLLRESSGDFSEAVRYAYLEVLTRPPTPPELSDALEVISSAASPFAGMADLRWALLNCHEFRFIP